MQVSWLGDVRGSLRVTELHFSVRVGFSKDGSTMSLGEEQQSYGFGGEGKAVTNAQFIDYGEKYGPGDVIGCYLVSSASMFCSNK